MLRVRMTLALFATLLFVAPAARSHAAGEAEAKPRLETLLRSALEGAPDTELIVSRVTIPPYRMLPKHWHPGEEFAYVLEGTVVLWQEGKDEVTHRVGDLVRIPREQVHSAITGEDGVTVLVFRVHDKGQPERVLVD